LSTLTSVAGVAHRKLADQDGPHSSIKARFSLGELWPVGLNGPVENDV